MPKVLRPYQVEAKEKILAAWASGFANVLLVKPTGLGKTATFCNIAIDLTNTRGPGAILVHRKELVQQISLTLAEEGIKHNIIASRETIKGIVAAQRRMFQKQFYDYNAPITVVSVDTLLAREKKHAGWADKIRWWITDEAAHVLRENKWGRAIALFTNAIGLGVTATPQRLDRRGLGRHADGVFDTMVLGPSSNFGIENGYLSDYRIVVPKGDYQNYLAAAKGDSDYTREAMAQASSQSHLVGDVVANYQKFADQKQAIVFASDIASASRMESAFRDSGITAKLLTGETNDVERLNALIDYREKRITVLVNVDLFDEGLDVPGIECVIMGRPTKSLGKYLQMVGRGLRPAPGKPYLVLIDHVGNVQEHLLPDQHRLWTLDRIVKRRQRVNLIRICDNVECNSPYDRLLDACPWCLTEPYANTRSSSGNGEAPPVRTLLEVDGDLQMLDRETLRAMYDRSVLEDPAKVADRVAAAAGPLAGASAMKKQRERIETQKELAVVIAEWAGFHRDRFRRTDRQIHKLFYLTYDMTITGALSEPREAMLNTIENLKGELPK